MNGTTAVRCRSLTRVFGEGDIAVRALDSVDLDIETGEFVVLLGPSGSGKTTLLNLIGGIDEPTSGEITVAGNELSRLDAAGRTAFRRDHVGFVFQFFNLIPTLRVLENVQLPAELRGLSPEDAAEKARVCLGDVGLSDREESFPDRLSGGEQQRVAIARALVQAPRILLADEPTGNLDDETGRTVMDLLDRVTRGTGRTLVVATHSTQVAARADRVFTIEHGRVVPLPSGEQSFGPRS